jgi:hypothetical protein
MGLSHGTMVAAPTPVGVRTLWWSRLALTGRRERPLALSGRPARNH